MLKEEFIECINYVYEKLVDLIVSWDNYSMQHIRLRSANEKRVEDSKQHFMEDMDRRKTQRFKEQADANYVAWKNSPGYDPKKDRRLNGTRY